MDMTDKDLSARLDALPKHWKATTPRPHRKGEELMPVIYADPGNNGWYYRERMIDSVTAYVRIDLIASGQIVTRAELDAAVLAARSNAIRDFCNAANIQPLIQVQNLPGDVRRYRMTEAIRARGVTE